MAFVFETNFSFTDNDFRPNFVKQNKVLQLLYFENYNTHILLQYDYIRMY